VAKLEQTEVVSGDPTAPLEGAPLPSDMLLAAIKTAFDLPMVDRDHYEVLAEYARGGLGRIVKARDRRTGRVVAIKEMLGSTDDAARRFAREALITANLQHPAIVPVYELGRWTTGEPFYAMKLVSGRSLKEVIDAHKTLDERLARLPIVVSVAEALAYAHERRIIHRDLKPANVLVGDFGETVVIDWGLAKTLGEADPSFDPIVVPESVGPMHTVVGAVLGTPSYMPPEQARGEPTDTRTDVYQIGAMLYHLIAGVVPYAGRRVGSSKELVKVVAHEAPKPLREREPGTPSDLLTIVDKAMARDPQQRYANAGELLDDLRRFTTGQLVRSHHYDRRTLFARWLKRNRAPITVGAVLATALVGFGAWSIRRILVESHAAQEQRDIALAQTSRAEDELATALYEKGRVAEGGQEWARAAMYYAAARKHHDSPEAAWAAGLAEARAVIPHARHTGHRAWVHAVAIAPDGERVATVDDAGQLRVWRPSDGRLIAARAMSPKALYAVAFSPDGHELALAGDDGVIQRVSVDLASASPSGDAARPGKAGAFDLAPLARLTGHTGRIWSLAYAPDGNALASAGEDRSVRIWSLAGGEPKLLAGHLQRVYTVTWSPDGTHLASGGDDRQLWIWERATATGKFRGEHKSGGIRVVAYTPAGDAIMTTGWDHEIRIWRGESAPEIWNDLDVIHGAAIAPHGNILVTGGELPAIHAWDLSTHQLITSLESQGGQTTAVAFSRDGRWFVTAGKSAPIAWDASAFRRLSAVGHRDAVAGLAFTADGKRFVSGAMDHTLRVWDATTGAELRRISTNVNCADGVLALGDDVVSACDDDTLRRWDPAGRERRLATNGWLRVTALSPDGTTVAAAHTQGHLSLVDVASWKLVSDRVLHAHHIYGVEYARDGRLVTASLDDHARVWRTSTTSIEAPPDIDVVAHTDDGILAAALAGTQLAIGTQDGSIHVWDTAANAWRVRDLGGGKLGTVWKLVVDPAGKRAFAASDDGIVRIYDTATWAAPEQLDAGEGPALALAISPDGTRVIAGYKSGAIGVWDPAAKKLLVRIGGRTRDRGTCADVATQAWIDDMHKAIVSRACSSDAATYFDVLAARSHQRLDGEIDVTWDWLATPAR
jgi:eukaryotic-like serine/threonine-protein kinase